jgi:N-acetylglucosaminyl-diphospho-decaprenol L-rhamnosyltransferase
MAPTFDVVIPAHGGWAHTERCLAALMAQTVSHTVIVVDNASPDDTVARVRAGFPEVRVLTMGENAGFSRAVNRGIAEGDAELVVVLNNDVTCAPDFLAHVAAAFANPAIGSAAPLLLRPGGERIDALGITADATLACFVRLQGRQADAAEREDGVPPLLGPHGAAAAYRRRALAEVGPLDERIFMYGEDLDLALRLRDAGWDAVTAPMARAVHEGGATAGKRSAWQRRQGGFGRGYLLRRYGVLRGRAALRALLTELIVVAGDVAISRDAAALRGRLAGWRAGRGHPRRMASGPLAPIGFRESLGLRVADYGLDERSATRRS